MHQESFNDYFNDNCLDVNVYGEKRYVALWAQDVENGEVVQINLGTESVKALIEHLNKAL